ETIGARRSDGAPRSVAGRPVFGWKKIGARRADGAQRISATRKSERGVFDGVGPASARPFLRSRRYRRLQAKHAQSATPPNSLPGSAGHNSEPYSWFAR